MIALTKEGRDELLRRPTPEEYRARTTFIERARENTERNVRREGRKLILTVRPDVPKR